MTSSMPSFGSPVPPARPPAAGRRWWPWILAGAGVIVLLVLALVAALILFLVLRSDPQDAVEDYAEALRTGDCEAFQEVTVQEFREAAEIADCAEFTEMTQTFSDYRVEIGDVRTQDGVSEITAQELVDSDVDRTRTPVTFYLMVEGGDWKVTGVEVTGEVESV